MLKILKGDSRVLIFASELGTRVKKVRCLSTQVCGWYIDMLGHMMAHSYMCFHRVKHTYVYRCMHVCSIHILNICIGRTYAPASQRLCPVQPRNQQLVLNKTNKESSAGVNITNMEQGGWANTDNT